jgi:hypothetical protein
MARPAPGSWRPGAAEISFARPPGTRSQSTACSRQATWVRARPRSRCRLDHTFSTAGWSSAVTGRQAPDRSAAIATDKASSGSFLSVSPACSRRTRQASFGCTSSTRPPAATSCRASSRPSPRAPSTAQVRSGHAAARATSSPAWAAQARTRSSPSGSSARPATTAVCEPLVRVHADHHCRHQHPPGHPRGRGENVAGRPNSRSARTRTSSEPRHGQTRQAGTSF